MLNGLIKNFSRGIRFVKENPQILYTVFLLVVIPLAFLFSGQKFLEVSIENQERLEKERIGLMQDVFALTALPDNEVLSTENSRFLQSVIVDIKKQNPAISEFKVIIRSSGKNIILASLNENEVGREDQENTIFYGIAGGDKDNSLISEHFVDGDRQWRAVRALQNRFGDIVGFVLTSGSMAFIDNAAATNIREAYYFLFFIILAIFILLVRQAKIIDYAVLYKKLKSVDQMKDDFISIAAHELRTPLSSMSGYIELISRENLSDDDKESVDRVYISIKRLKGLVNDILDVARIQQGRMKFVFEKVDISETIGAVVDSFQSMANEKSLSLSYEKKALEMVSVDVGRFEQVLINLVGNAIKYTPSGSVKVVTRLDSTSGGDFVQVRVSDTGLGISSENQKKLFQRFHRVKTRDTADISGTGLGLWIAQEMIVKMGGKITVESIKGKGSDFIISLPVV